MRGHSTANSPACPTPELLGPPVEQEPDFWVRWPVDAAGDPLPGGEAVPVNGPSLDDGLEPEPVGWPEAPTRRPATPYRDGWQAHWDAGWRGLVPITRPREGKGQPLRAGLTGWRGIDPTRSECARFARRNGGCNIALRVPADVLAIDVDDHVMPDGHRKRGGETIAALTEVCGPLPPTWKLTSRGAGLSGKHFFRITPGLVTLSALTDVELIARHLRYALTWPSTNGHDHGRVVHWHDPADGVADRVPSPGELPELPQAWAEGLRVDGTGRGAAPVEHSEVAEFWASLPPGPPCSRVIALLDRAEADAVRRGRGSRYEATRDHALGLLIAGDDGHHGAVDALWCLRESYVSHQRDGGDSREKASAEFDRFTGLCCAQAPSPRCARGCPGQRVIGLVTARRDENRPGVCICAENHAALLASVEPELRDDLAEALRGWAA